MANTGGSGATVLSCGTSAAGRSAKVRFPPPPAGGREEIYTELTLDEYNTFLHGFSGASAVVDVTCDSGGSVTGVTVRR